MMHPVSTHSLKDITDQEIGIHKFSGTGRNVQLNEKSAHRRDDHYLFIFQQQGKSKIIIDFKEVELVGRVVLCVSPGQIHLGVAANKSTAAWLITLDSNLVSDDYRTIFDDHYFQYEPFSLSKQEGDSLNQCIELIVAVKEKQGKGACYRK